MMLLPAKEHDLHCWLQTASTLPFHLTVLVWIIGSDHSDQAFFSGYKNKANGDVYFSSCLWSGCDRTRCFFSLDALANFLFSLSWKTLQWVVSALCDMQNTNSLCELCVLAKKWGEQEERRRTHMDFWRVANGDDFVYESGSWGVHHEVLQQLEKMREGNLA